MNKSLCSALSISAVLIAACDASNPVAPPPVSGPSTGSGSFNVVVSASPTQVEVGATEPLKVTVTATRADDGQPAADGTQAVVNTDLGSLAAGGGATANLVNVQLAGGRAQVDFLPGDKLGTATLLAQVGSSIGSLKIAVVEQVPESFFITAVVPSVGDPEGGETVTVVGDGFVPPLLVSFANAQATVTAVTSPQEIVVVTPPAVAPVPAGNTLLVDVSVTKELSAATPKRTTLPGAFTYATKTLPTVFVTRLDPASGAAAGDTEVALIGGGFREPLRVEFATAIATLRSVTEGRIVVVTPPSATPVAAGQSLAVDVTLHNALDVGTQPPVLLPKAFNYLGAAPPPGSAISVTSAQPTEGSYRGGTLVVANGSGFVEPLAVDLGGVRQREERLFNANAVQFTTAGVAVASCPPSGRVSQQGLTVTNLGTGAQGSLATFVFDYLVPLPRMTTISPTSGGQAGDVVVQIGGSGFEDPVRVLFTVAGQSFVGTSPTTGGTTSVQVRTPQVPDSVFQQVPCTTGTPPDVQQGVKNGPTPADLQVINLLTGCTDTLPNAFTYRPTDETCRTR